MSTQAPPPLPAAPAPVPWRDDLKVAALLALLAGLSVAAVFPYLLQTLPEASRAAIARVPLPVLVVAQSIQGALLIGMLSLLGLRMGHRVGLGAPLLQHWINRRPRPVAAVRPLQCALLGAIAAALVLAVAAVIDPALPAMRHPPAAVDPGRSALHGLLASFYGGIAEELQLRLFLMTLLVWSVAKLRRSAAPPWAYWGALVLAAVLFGAGHLPAAGQIWGWAGIVVFRTILLNAIAGLLFGWLYWKRGLEMAVLAHFSADIVLHVLAPLLGAKP